MRRLSLASLLVTGIFTLSACGGGGSSNPPPNSSASSISSASSSSSSSSSVSSSMSSSSSVSSSSSTSSTSSWAVNVESLKALADFPIGVAVSAGNETHSIFRDNEAGAALRAIVEQHFDQVTAGNIMKMSYLQPQQDNFTFGNADELVDYAEDNGISVHGHALIWHSNYQVPGWMNSFDGDWSEMLKTHVETIAAEYAGKVVSWDVVNEAFLDNGNYRNNEPNGQGSLFYRNMSEVYIEEAFTNARAADPTADLYYNDFNLSPGGAKLNAVLAMVDDFIERDIPIDGVGFQMHVYLDWPSASTIKNSFEQVIARGLKVKITELDIPINNPFAPINPFSDDEYDFPNNYHAELTPALANAQKIRYCEVVKAYLEATEDHPELRGGITVWGVFDTESWLINQLFDNQHTDWPLLFGHDFEPKPALQGFANGLTGAPCDQ